MRSTFRPFFVIALLFSCSSIGLQGQGSGGGVPFSVQDFEGDWALTCHGDVVVFDVGQFPFYCVGHTQFDRAGNFRTRRTSSFGGGIAHMIIEGVYSLDPDGSGLGTFEYTEYQELPDGSKGPAGLNCVDRNVAVSRDEILLMGVACVDAATGAPLPAGPAAGGALKRQRPR